MIFVAETCLRRFQWVETHRKFPPKFARNEHEIDRPALAIFGQLQGFDRECDLLFGPDHVDITIGRLADAVVFIRDRQDVKVSVSIWSV